MRPLTISSPSPAARCGASPIRRVCWTAWTLLMLLALPAAAQTELLSIEFNEDDQPGFELWPGGISGSSISASFGGITVDVSTNTSFAQPVNRGSQNGVPPGYSYQHLYEDLLHAFTPTGTLTLDFGGLQPNELYTFTLYAWDPGSTGAHEWSVTSGTGVPAVITVDWSQPLVDNESFALRFNVTTTSAGSFQIDNTDGLAGSAINGFKLSVPGTSYCTGTPNSTGSPGQMSAGGSTSVVSNNLVLYAGPVPNQPGLFFYGPDQIQVPFGNGFRCVGGTIGRLDVHNALANTLSHALDLNAPPNSATVISAGSTWNFQCWYRDPAAGGASFNLSDGLELTFLP